MKRAAKEVVSFAADLWDVAAKETTKEDVVVVVFFFVQYTTFYLPLFAMTSPVDLQSPSTNSLLVTKPINRLSVDINQVQFKGI